MLSTSAARVALVRDVFAAYNARDVDGLLALAHPDVELVPGPAFDRPGTVFRGREGLRTFASDAFTRQPAIRLEVRSSEDLGQWLLVTGLRRGRHDREHSVWLFAFQDDLVRRVLNFAHDADARAAAERLSGGGRALELTPREREIFRLLADGYSAPEIAQALHLSPATVRTHVQNGMARLGARSRIQAVAEALARGELA
jgi:DNA-binding CsgD family transcriptional regulator